MKILTTIIKSCVKCPYSMFDGKILSCPYSKYQTDMSDEILPDCPLPDNVEENDEE